MPVQHPSTYEVGDRVEVEIHGWFLVDEKIDGGCVLKAEDANQRRQKIVLTDQSVVLQHLPM